MRAVVLLRFLIRRLHREGEVTSFSHYLLKVTEVTSWEPAVHPIVLLSG